MSTTIDQKVVEMRFDNRQFENNVQTSMSTINRLKQSLQMEGATKGFDNINRAAQSIKLDVIAAGVEALQNRFSTLGIVGMRVIERLTDSMLSFGSKTLSFVKNGIISGGLSRAMKLENAHFQLQGLLKDETEVAAVMKNVGDAVDGTAYGLDAAAAVASQLAASGMKAGDGMFTALRGVAGVAAMTNSSYEDIGRIYTQVAGQGRLMGDQLLQLSGRGMNAAATLAEYLGKSEKEVREMVSKGKIDFATFAAAMDDAFGEHAKKANETLTGAFSNVKAALGRIGAKFISPLIEQNGPIVKFLNAVRERINDINKNIDSFANMFTSSVSRMAKVATNFVANLDLTNKIKIFYNLVEVVKNVGKAVLGIVKPIQEAFVDIFPPIASERLVKLSEGLKNFSEKLKVSEQTADKLKRTFKGVFSFFDIFRKLAIAVLKPVSKLFDGVSGFVDIVLTMTASIGDFFTALNKNLKFDSLASGLSDLFSGVSNVLSNASKNIRSFGDIFTHIGETVGGVLNYIGKAIMSVFGWIHDNISIKDFFAGLAAGGAYVAVKQFISILIMIKKALFNLLGSDNKLKDDFKNLLLSLKISLQTFTQGVKVSSLISIALAVGILSAAMRTLSKIKVVDIVKSLGAMGVMFAMLNYSFRSITKSLEKYPVKGLVKAGVSMMIMATAIKILSNTIIKLSSVSLLDIAKGLSAIGVGMSELVFALKAINNINIKVSTSIAILALAKSCKILGDALVKFGSMKWGEITKGLIGMGGALAEMTIVLKYLNKFGGMKSISGGLGLLITVQSLSKMADGLKKFGGLSWKEIQKGLVGMGGALIEVAGVTGTLGKIAGFSSLFASGAIVIVTNGLSKLADSLTKFGSMSWGEIRKGLSGMGGALGEVSISVGALGKIAGFSSLFASGAILITIQGLGKLADSFKKFAGMTWGEIAKGFVGMGGALGEIAGISGMLGKIAGFSSLFASGAILITIQGLGKLADNFKKFGSMSWDEIGRGMVAMGGALLEVGGISGGLGAIAGLASILGGAAIWTSVQGLGKLADGLKKFGEMSWGEIGRGLTAMAGALGDIALGGIANTFSIIGSWSIDNMAEDIGVLADSVKKWKDVQVPENLGTQLGLLAAGVSQFNFSNAGAAAISIVAPAIGTLADSVKKWGGVYIRDGLGDDIGSLAAGVRKFTFSGAGAGALAISAESVGSLADSVRKWNSVTIPEGLGDDLKEIANGVGAFAVAFVGGWSINAVINPLSKLADSVNKWKNVTIPDSLKKDLTNLADGVKSFTWAFMGGWSLDAINGPLARLATSVSKWKNVSVPEDLSSQLTKLSSGVKSFTWAFAGGWSLDTVAGPLGSLADAVKKWKGVSIPDDMGTKLKSLAGGVRQFNTIGDISTAASSTIKIANAAARLSQVNFKLISSGLSTFTSSLVAFSSSSSSISGIGERIVSNVIKPINSAGPKFTAAGGRLIASLARGMSTKTGTISSSLGRSINKALVSVNTKKESFTTTGSKLGTALSNGVNKGATKAKTTIIRTLSTISISINSYYGSFYAAGSYLVTGFANGISQNMYKSTAKAEAMAKAAKNAAEEALGIKSPSKVFTKIGDYTGLGFINGLTPFVDKARKVTTQMGETAREGLNSAIKKVTTFIDSDMDREPTIRPVLDLSSVKSGAKEINGMFGSNLALNTTVGSISTMMNSRSQNGVNDDVVSAINKLGRSLGNMGGDTYHVDGITYDDGTNVSDAVRTLIRAARIERRI